MISEPLKFFIVAGDPSGELHGAHLINAIKKIEPNSSFMGHGGNKMKDAGMHIIEHTDQLAIMGFLEVIKHLPRMVRIMGETINIIKKAKPDRVILIDYPGFNLKLAKNIKHLCIPITYFILPQAWAWKEKRVETLISFIDQSISIFPFEKTWYDKKGLETTYVGHPFVEEKHFDETSKEFYNRHGFSISYPILLLLPGSRQQEINKHWEIYLSTALFLKKRIPKLQILVGKSQYVNLKKIPKGFRIETDSRKAMHVSTAAIATSGTATLECLFEDTPLVVCYKLSSVSWLLAKLLVKVQFASIVNLIAGKMVVPELLQNQCTKLNIAEKILPLLDIKSQKRIKMIDEFNNIKDSLGLPGVYNRTAENIIKRTKE
jgi:lipid-A-disaccharide synthase|tara:strand:+ start:1873 stop:2997 length:1125 start_codon:yes stop_codon:yes gene_type:complete